MFFLFVVSSGRTCEGGGLNAAPCLTMIECCTDARVRLNAAPVSGGDTGYLILFAVLSWYCPSLCHSHCYPKKRNMHNFCEVGALETSWRGLCILPRRWFRKMLPGTLQSRR